MKKLIYSCLFAISSILTISFSSCSDYLDTDKYFNDMLNLDTVFTKKNYTEQWLTNVYSKLNSIAVDIRKHDSGFNYASDDQFYGDWDGRGEKYQNCEYSPTTQLDDDRWGRVYEGIRDASTFIYNVDKCMEMTMNERVDNKGQARFLRAYFYWVLLRQYGPIPIMPEEGMDINASYEELSVARNTYDECVDYITDELVQAARMLPTTRTSSNLARPTRGAALALRAKVYLYAASPLFNGNKDYFNFRNPDGTQLINQEYSEEKWARAAAAAKEVIDLNQYTLLYIQKSRTTIDPPVHPEYSNKPFPEGWEDIDPFESYRQVFNGMTVPSKNPELIFMRVEGSNNINAIVQHQLPRDINGWNTCAATQKQVDAYYMVDGNNITNSSAEYPYRTQGFTQGPDEYPFVLENVHLMYVNREPRFYASIGFNGSLWENLSTTQTNKQNYRGWYYKGKVDGKQLSSPGFYLRTGIGIKKYYNPEDSWNEGGARIRKTEPSIRYADVLLWYAEALNELTSGQSYTLPTFDEQTVEVKRDVAEMRKGMKPIRMRAGLPDFSNTIYQDADQFRIALKRERQIEFFAEAARYFDLRRWKDAPKEESIPITGCDMDRSDADNQKEAFHYPPVPTNIKKVWLEKMYLWPISNNEMRRNKNLVQAPGWE